MSPFDHIFLITGIIGLVVLLHASPIPLPNRKPFNCALCLCSWTAIAIYAVLIWNGQCSQLAAISGVGTTALVSMLSVGFAPWMWRGFPP